VWTEIIETFAHMPLEAVTSSTARQWLAFARRIFHSCSLNSNAAATGCRQPQNTRTIHDVDGLREVLAGLEFQFASELERDVIEFSRHTDC